MTLNSKSAGAAQHTYAASEEEHREHPDVRARRPCGRCAVGGVMLDP